MSQIAPVQHREQITVEKRRPLTRRQLIELMLRQDGKCGCGCKVKLEPVREGVIDEHVGMLAMGGPNDLENRSLWRKPCSVAKTKIDVAMNAKANRLIKKADPEQRKPSQNQSRGFDKSKSKKFNGQVVPREVRS